MVAGDKGVARIARVVVPGLPHHVTQRGNPREPVFFEAWNYRLYGQLIAAAARRAGAEIWAYCLMPNHVHVIVTPTDHDGCERPSPKRTAVTPVPSTLGSNGRAICFRAASARW
jgi:REP element-mobilizing transposase RayT